MLQASSSSNEDRYSTFTIENGKIQLDTFFIDPPQTYEFVPRTRVINTIPQPFFEMDHHISKNNYERKKMMFNNYSRVSDFQKFYQNYGIFPESVQGPNKMICNPEDVPEIILHDLILISLFNSSLSENDYLKRKAVQNNLASFNMYVSIGPRSPENQSQDSQYIQHLILDGYMSLFQLFRSKYFKFTIDLQQQSMKVI
jgi:hypothetical protein